MFSSPSLGTQLVTDRFIMDWRTWFGSVENQVIVTSVDGRGSSGRGDDFLHTVQRQLGTSDVTDQLEAIRYALSPVGPTLYTCIIGSGLHFT